VGAYITLALGIGATPIFVSCGASDFGAQPLIQFQPNINVPAGAIIVQGNEGIPQPGANYWVALRSCNLGPNLPPWGASDQNLHFSAAPTAAPSGA